MTDSNFMPTPVSNNDEPTAKKKKSGGGLKFAILAPLVLIILGIIAAVAVFGPGPFREAHTIVIPMGSKPRDVAMLLNNEGVIYNPYLFRAVVKYMAGGSLKAGEYQFTALQSMADIVQMIHDGRSVTRLFKVAEGLTSAEVMQLLNAAPTLGGDPVTTAPTEGTLLPESYRYIYGDTRAALVTRMQKSMDELMAEEWPKRDMTLPLTSPEQAVVMASVIEKETGKPAERPRIAAVFYNRLKNSMRLQSDPTVIYGIVQAKGELAHPIDHDDLAFVSPYNTYTNDGLPPHPICNPGKASILAALHPEQSDYLYFVADGTGGHAFAHNLTEHNANVTKWNDLKSK